MRATLTYAITVAGLAALYFVGAKLGLELAFFHASATPVWPPTGIAIAALLLGGLRLWPGVLLGAFIANATTDVHLAAAAGIGIGNTIEAVAGAWLTLRFCRGLSVFERPADIFKYAALAAGLSTSLAATIGVTSLCLSGDALWDNFGRIWLTWWLGDAVSAVIVVPLILIAARYAPPAITGWRWLEGAALLIVAIASAGLIFGGITDESRLHYPLGFAIIPAVLWAAFRFGRHGAVALGVVLSAIAIAGTLQEFGPFAIGDHNSNLMLLQGFMGTVTLSGLVLAAAEAQRRSASRELEASDAQYRAIVEGQAEMVCRFQPDGQILFVNSAYAQARGTIPERLVGCNFWDFIDQGDRAAVRALLDQLRPEAPEIRIENRFETDRGVRWTLWTNRGLAFDAAGRAATVQSTGIDITERKRAEQALHESEARLRLALQGANAGVWTLDVASGATFWSDEFYPLYGLDRDAPATFTTWIERVHPDDRDRIVAAHQARLASSTTDFRQEYRIVHPERGVLWVLDLGHIERDGAGRAITFAGINIDITDRKRLEEELRRHREHLEQLIQERTAELEKSHEALRLSERMAAMGTLAAGLGHDMGNLLLPIRARLDLLRAEASSPAARSHIDSIAQCVTYLQSLTRGLRLFAKDPGQEAAGTTTDLAAWLDEVGPFFRNVLPASIEFSTSVAPGTPQIEMADHALTQAVLNLINNARDAVTGRNGANISLRIEPASDGEEHEGPTWVRVTIADNGPGMTPEIKARALEPFFTTKTRSISTGLGLSLVHGIAQAAGGSMEIDSAPGAGAAISLILPAARLEAGGQGDASQSAPRGVAVVTIQSPRNAAIVRTVLDSFGYLVQGPEEDLSGAMLWITDDSREALARAAQVRGSLHGAIIVIGKGGREWVELGAVAIGESVNLSTLRSAIEHAAAAHRRRHAQTAVGSS